MSTSTAHVAMDPERAFDLRPLHPTVGQEVIGLDLSADLSEPTVDEIRALCERHGVLLFRNQSLTEERQVAFTRYFGEPALPSDSRYRSRQNPEVMRIGNVDLDGTKLEPDHTTVRYFTISERWHSDGSARPIPSYVSVLYSLEIPDEGGDTCFCSMVSAYEALPEEQKQRLEGKQMVHNRAVLRLWDDTVPPLTIEEQRKSPPMTHPVVRTLPSGLKTLFVTANVAYYIGGMPIEQGERLHAEMIAFATRPEFVYAHKWQVGDLLMWDNRTTMHQVTPYDRRKRRLLQRTEVTGTEIPV